MGKKTKRQSNAGFRRAVDIFKKNGGMLRTSVALRDGIHPVTFYAMREAGVIEQLSRGFYRLAGEEPIGNPDLVLVAAKIPKGVLCLISALSFHELTLQVPHQVYIALERGAETPRLDHPPLRIFRFSGLSLTEGVDVHKMDGIDVRIYGREKTIADCFKFRNRIGLDTAIEALRFYREKKGMNVDALMHFAAICRVEKVMRPYLEAML